MATLKEKMFYFKNGFQNGKLSIDGKGSLFFLNEVLNELSSDSKNIEEFKDDIPHLYNSCIEELKISPQETKMILLNNILINSGINSTIKNDLIVNTPIFKNFLENKNSADIYKEVDTLFDFAFDEKYKRIEIDTLISVATSALNKKPSESILYTYVGNDLFDEEKITNVMAAVSALKELNEDSVYNLTAEQQEDLKSIVIKINEAKSEDKSFSDKLDSKIEHYKKFVFFNYLNIEAQLHEIKNESEMDGSGGFISSHPIEESLNDTLKNKEKRDNLELDVSAIKWEEKYRDYLNSLNNVKVMSSTDKFRAKFASHGFAPATASLFGDSVVMVDKFGDPQRTLWNVSGLTGTMRLSRDVDYSDPKVAEQTFAIAALNARRNKWPTVYLSHPGPDGEAKQFLESSITAMVEIGNYNFDEIQVQRKYKHILDHIKNNYTFIEKGNKLENVENDNIVPVSDNVPVEEIINTKNDFLNVSDNDLSSDIKNTVDNGTDLSGFDSENTIFEDAGDNLMDRNEYIGNEDYEAPLNENMDDSGINFGNAELEEDRYYKNVGDLNLDESSKDFSNENTIQNNSSDKKHKKIKLFKNT